MTPRQAYYATVDFLEDKVTKVAASLSNFWREGSARALETHIAIVCELGFNVENRDPGLYFRVVGVTV